MRQTVSSEPTRRAVTAGLAAGALAAGLTPMPARAIGTFRRSGGGLGPDHGAWSALLSRHVRVSSDGVNRVDYRGFKGSSADALKAYVAGLESTAPGGMNRSAQFAYWVNLYNAKTIDIVIDHFPVRSIRDIRLGGGGLFGRGPWKKKVMTVEGTPLSLDDIEHRILRPFWGDARVHYAVNCASIGCPNLQTRAFSTDRLEAMLDRAAIDYINHPRGVAVGSGGVTASKIYDWFAADFGGRNGLSAHWRRYARGSLAEKLSASPRIAGYAYDWSLNGL